MDQVVGAVMRSIEIPAVDGAGVGNLFNAFLTGAESGRPTRLSPERDAVTDHDRWSISHALRCPALWIALRSWHLCPDLAHREFVADYLASSWDHTDGPSLLYQRLVRTLPLTVRDPRSLSSMIRDNVFKFDTAGHQPSWDALNDLRLLALMSGYRGLVLLFDEFEDVIQNMNNIAYERAAFNNLLRLFDESAYQSWAYFAVTPEFAEKCRDRLFEMEHYDYPVDRFDDLERIRMDPVTLPQFRSLADSIRDVHGIAYEWNAASKFPQERLDQVVMKLYSRSSADQVRQAMIGLVDEFDRGQDE